MQGAGDLLFELVPAAEFGWDPHFDHVTFLHAVEAVFEQVALRLHTHQSTKEQWQVLVGIMLAGMQQPALGQSSRVTGTSKPHNTRHGTCIQPYEHVGVRTRARVLHAVSSIARGCCSHHSWWAYLEVTQRAPLLLEFVREFDRDGGFSVSRAAKLPRAPQRGLLGNFPLNLPLRMQLFHGVHLECKQTPREKNTRSSISV